MAKQAGSIIIKGGIDNIIFYERNGKFFLRKKGDISRKKVLNDWNFANTKRHSTQLGIASQLASSLYWKIDKKERSGGLFNCLVGLFKIQLAKGKMEEEIRKDLLDSNYEKGFIKLAKCKTERVDSSLRSK